MEVNTVSTILLVLVVLFLDVVISDSEYMVTTPETISLLLGFKTLLTCEMNIEPDKFQWKFYPSSDPHDPNAPIYLRNSTFHLLPEDRYTEQRKKSELPLQVESTKIAGDYQCLAYYGAYVVASVPWRVTIAAIKLPRQTNADVTVMVGNTVAWRCLQPESNPEVYIDYFKDQQYVLQKTQTKSLILPNVAVEQSGVYTCNATNVLEKVKLNTRLNLRVVRNAPTSAPLFIIPPKESYTVLKGNNAFLECAAIGNPVPKVFWFKKDGRLPSSRIEMLSGGLEIKNITSADDGVYICNHTNIYGTISHSITLVYNEEPSIDCLTRNIDIKQGENLDLDCAVQGTPEPYTTWFLNGFSVSNDSKVEAIGNKIYFNPIEKRHAGNLQLFARNNVGTVYSSVSIRVIPLSTSIDEAVTPAHSHRRHKSKTDATRNPSKHNKPPKMIPPTKPIISRLSDESVVVRWNVPNNNGLPIQFFKVQYRELGPANSNDLQGRKGLRWRTTNADIPPNIKVYDVLNLKPDHIYKFRIAAVYSNNDNKLSPNSDKFHLRRLDFDDKNPLPIPVITETGTVNVSSVKIAWECNKMGNVSIDGFYISYMSASTAGDYMKATVDGESVREYTITHLQVDTIYDIKLQSFNSKFASDFSQIMKARTSANVLSATTLRNARPTGPTPSKDTSGSSNLYVIVAGAVVVFTLLVSGVVLLFVCRKWQRDKSDTTDKVNVDDHHIQVEGNEYVVGPKSVTRANGCALPQNRITITPNPLADADTKNQNMIEMTCLTAQNNNCASTSPASGSADTRESPHAPKEKSKKTAKEKNKKLPKDKTSGEKYV